MLRTNHLSLLFTLPLVAGCVGLSKDYVEKQQYVLEVVRKAEPVPGRAVDAIVSVRSFTAGPGLDGRGLVYRTDDARFEQDFYHEFFVVPTELVTGELRRWMRDMAAFRAVVDPGSLVEADYVIDGCVTKLFGDYRGEPAACLELQLFLTRYGPGGPELVFSTTLSERVVAESKEPEQLVAAFNRALERALAALEGDEAFWSGLQTPAR